MSPTQEIALREAVDGTVAQLRDEGFEHQVALALPQSVTPERFLRVAQTAVLEDNNLAKPELRSSLVKAVLKSAQDGLLPDGREAALVIFGKEVVYMPMIGGFRKIAAEHGWSLDARIVYENDHFEERPFEEPPIVHHPVRPGAERGQPIAAVARARHRDGRTMFKVMDAAEIARVREASRGKSGDLWVKWWDRAWQKTVARALFKELPLDPADATISRLISAGENGAANAAAQIYGPKMLEPGQSRSVPQRGGNEGFTPSLSNTGGDETPSVPAGASGEPPLEGEIVSHDEELTLAGAYTVPLVEFNGSPLAASGKSLADVADNSEGEPWFQWALEHRDIFPPEFIQPLDTFVRLRFPELVS